MGNWISRLWDNIILGVASLILILLFVVIAVGILCFGFIIGVLTFKIITAIL